MLRSARTSSVPLLWTTPTPPSMATLVAPSTFQDRVAVVPAVTCFGATVNLTIARSSELSNRPSMAEQPAAIDPAAMTVRTRHAIMTNIEQQ